MDVTDVDIWGRKASSDFFHHHHPPPTKIQLHTVTPAPAFLLAISCILSYLFWADECHGS